MKFVLTGGHLTPAYSFAEVGISHKDTINILGSAGALSVEAKELCQLGCGYHTIRAVKIDRHHRWVSILKLPLLIIPLTQSLHYLRQFKPDVVVGFGGFNAIPACIAAFLLGIPFVLHEQTRSAGLANRVLGRFARCCAVSYPESLAHFPSKKTLVSGNLLRSSIWSPPMTSPWVLPQAKPVLYITGGNQGSRVVNDYVAELLPALSLRYQVVWQYGKNNPFRDRLPPTDIVAKPWFSLPEISWLIHHAHIIVSRGGANTTAEIMVGGIPSVIIPIPGTSADEQAENARTITAARAGLTILQSELTAASLQSAIKRIETDYAVFKQYAGRLKHEQHPDAAEILYREVCKVSGHP